MCAKQTSSWIQVLKLAALAAPRLVQARLVTPLPLLPIHLLPPVDDSVQI
jgi:hypothetical protein